MTISELPAIEPVVKFHLSLNVSSLHAALSFYRVLFGIEPAKCHDDYAKFELEDPPVIFSLVPRAPGPGGSLSHLGFRVSSVEQVRQTQERLAAAGICTQDQCGTVCGYARQDKVWTKDPDGNFWEVYVIEEDIEPALVRRTLEGRSAHHEPVTSGPIVWEDYLGNSWTGAIPHSDNSVDEVRLTGTFNAPLDESARAFVTREVMRVLKPGGKVITHGLMSDRPLSGPPPKLPGMAAMVASVPDRGEVVAFLTHAGFVGLQATKLTEQPWFVHEGIGLREVKFLAWKPVAAAANETRQVLFKGPFAQATADGGWLFPRGRRVSVPAAVWHQLRLGAAAEQFLFFDPANEQSTCQ
jgi:hypothetical protein